MGTQLDDRDNPNVFWGPPWEYEGWRKNRWRRQCRCRCVQPEKKKRSPIEEYIPPEPEEGKPTKGNWEWTGGGWKNLDYVSNK